jgi:hypothetical protein
MKCEKCNKSMLFEYDSGDYDVGLYPGMYKLSEDDLKEIFSDPKYEGEYTIDNVCTCQYTDKETEKLEFDALDKYYEEEYEREAEYANKYGELFDDRI